MYAAPHFRIDDLSELHTTIEQSRLASFVTASADGLLASHIPLYLDAGEAENGVLYGHIARANRQWRSIPSMDALAIFTGPEAYVTPGWYAAKQEHGRVVPTWNYAAVQASGPVEFIQDRTQLLTIVSRLTAQHEASQPHPWQVTDAPEDFIDGLLAGIVGIRMPITRIEGIRKASQNRSEADQAGVRAGLENSACPLDRQAAALMKR